MCHGSEKRCKEVSDEGRKSNYEEVQGYVFSALLEGEAVDSRKLRSTADWVDPGTKKDCLHLPVVILGSNTSRILGLPVAP
jgi:hypothetical protein